MDAQVIDITTPTPPSGVVQTEAAQRHEMQKIASAAIAAMEAGEEYHIQLEQLRAATRDQLDDEMLITDDDMTITDDDIVIYPSDDTE